MRQGLIVDDSAVIRKVAGRILELLRFESSETEDGAKALEHCAQYMPDVIMLDWTLPDMDTLDFLRNLRRLPGGATPKVLFCATENDAMAIGRALRAGADEVLFKPFDHNSVKMALEDVGLIL